MDNQDLFASSLFCFFASKNLQTEKSGLCFIASLLLRFYNILPGLSYGQSGPLPTEKSGLCFIASSLLRIFQEKNAKKFQVMRYGKNENLKENTMYFTEDTSEIVERQEVIRDLGVLLSEDGGFKHHLEKVVTKTRQKMGWVLRTFESRSPQLMKTLLKTLILPHIDYCSQLYCPTRPADIQKLEKLQKYFLKRIPALRQQTYWQQLETFQLYSIQRRLERYRIIYVWKALELYVPSCGVKVTHTRETRLSNSTGPACIMLCQESCGT